MFETMCIIGFFACIVCTVMSIVSLFKKNGKTKKFAIEALITLIIFMVGAINTPDENIKDISVENSQKTVATSSKNTEKKPNENKVKRNNTKEEKDIKGTLKVHYINVGQADSILIQQGRNNMLIDAGNNTDGQKIKNYLVQQGVNNLDFLIGTHPHADHIGGMDYVINSLKIGKIYMPKAVTSTKTYKNTVAAVQNKGLKITLPSPGNSFKLGEATCTVLAPNEESYKDFNNYSIVIKIQFGENSFIFTGDAEAISEMEMVKKGLDLNADVLKVGHHGSNSSTCINFLNAVNPKYAVLSVGNNNKYNHPHKGTMDRLKSKKVKVYRTDENGTIVATSDGKNISFNTKPGSFEFRGIGEKTTKSTSSNIKKQSTDNSNNKKTVTKPSNVTQKSVNKNKDNRPANKSSQNNEQTVYITNTGGKYHTSGCQYLRKSKIPIKKSQARSKGYSPCSKCGA